jgi:predicted RNA-binding Zn ribbon-like protein
MMVTSTAFEFDLSGGALCLDFVNTLGDRLDEPKEHLRSYEDLLEFARQAGSLPEPEVAELASEAAAEPEHAERTTAEAVRAREVLFRIFRAIAAGQRPRDSDLDALNSVLVEGLAKARLVREGDHYRWSWAGDCSCLERPLWQIAHSAADLLASSRLDRVRVCDSDTCDWLFLDESRNRSRRWCDMSTCGNRAKARRHYEKVKSKGD